ncbi:alpha/beta hydrolase [Amycolatopsis aidingensis]|uniref:alpha/beta hydrolase n=1 Tax=Amycolatopsis aidingensis TaxID=2842453 RepID=UPI001C0C6B38|nr:alpha/beta hydrolase [Amycolatopsis aidingensis]
MPGPTPATLPARRAVLLPGTGSDEVFVRSVFAGPLRALGLEVLAPPPPPAEALTSGYLARLDAEAEAAREPLLVGGISLGAHLAAEWALREPARCAGVLAAMPAWNGLPAAAPARQAALVSAEQVDRDGLDATLARSAAAVPAWLAAELDRAWRRYGEGLATGLRAAASHPAPELAELRLLGVPVGIATCTDDPVHPAAVAWEWAAALPSAAVCETTLEALGRDRESLGRATVLAWLRARGRSR